MSFLSFKYIRRTLKYLSLSGRIHRESYRSGVPQPLHPEYGIFADLPDVPEISDSFVQDLSSFTTDEILQTPELTTISTSTEDVCLNNEEENQEEEKTDFFLKRTFDRQHYSRSLFPRDTNDRYKEEKVLRKASTVRAPTQHSHEHRYNSETTRPNSNCDQYDELQQRPPESQRQATEPLPLDLGREKIHQNHTRSLSNEAADALFFLDAGSSSHYQERARVVSAATTTTADPSYIIHDHSELSNAEDDGTPQVPDASTEVVKPDILPSALTVTLKSSGHNSLSSVFVSSASVGQQVSKSNKTNRMPAAPTSRMLTKPLPRHSKRALSTSFKSSALVQSRDVDNIVPSTYNSLVGSHARAAAALGTQPRTAAASRSFYPPQRGPKSREPKKTLPNFIPFRGPSGLPQHTSWKRASSFCSKNINKVLRYDRILATIEAKRASRAAQWRTQGGANELWQEYLQEREEKMGKQPWDEVVDQNTKNEESGDGELLGTGGRHMNQQQWVQDRLYAKYSPSSKPENTTEPYNDRLATIERSLDAKASLEPDTHLDAKAPINPKDSLNSITSNSPETYSQILQTNAQLKSALASATSQARIQRLSSIDQEITRVQHELTSLENELCNPYADDGAKKAEEVMRHAARNYDPTGKPTNSATVKDILKRNKPLLDPNDALVELAGMSQDPCTSAATASPA